MPRFHAEYVLVKAHERLQQVVRLAFPQYRKTRARIVPTTSVELHDLNWSGGTRAEYATVKLSPNTGLLMAAPLGKIAHPADNRDEGRKVDLELGTLVVQAGEFCGKPSIAWVHIRPEDIERVLGLDVATALLIEE